MSPYSRFSGLLVAAAFSATTFGVHPLMENAIAQEHQPTSIYSFTMKDIDGKDVSLARYKGKTLLLVNVASRCGNTPQYKELEELFETYKDRGLMVLGFPANNFGWQEPGSNEEIKAFCTTNYNVHFDMFSKISVRGSDQHPLYRFLTSAETNPKFSGKVTWNFQKYLIDPSGNIVAKFSPRTNPMSEEVRKAVEMACGMNGEK